MSRGVIGNTSDSGSEEFRFETWRDNHDAGTLAGILILVGQVEKFTPTLWTKWIIVGGDLTRQPDIQPLTIDIVSGFLFVARLNSLNPIEGFVAILGHLKGLMPPYTIQYLCDRYSVDLCQFPDSIANHIYSLAVCSIFHLF